MDFLRSSGYRRNAFFFSGYSLYGIFMLVRGFIADL